MRILKRRVILLLDNIRELHALFCCSNTVIYANKNRAICDLMLIIEEAQEILHELQTMEGDKP